LLSKNIIDGNRTQLQPSEDIIKRNIYVYVYMRTYGCVNQT